MTDHRRLSDQEFIAWSVERIPRYWKTAAAIVMGTVTFVSAFSVTAYQMKVNEQAQKSDHADIGELKMDVAQIRGKVEQISAVQEDVRELRRDMKRLIGFEKDRNAPCLDDEVFERRIIDGIRAAMDNERRR